MFWKSYHFGKIHARVTKRLWSDLPRRVREIIAADPTGDTGQWFCNKVNTDAERLYQDPDNHYNDPFSFSHNKENDKLVIPQLAEAA